jgi:hypothetical protein
MHRGENRKIRKWDPLVNSICTLPVAPGREAQAQFCPALRGEACPSTEQRYSPLLESMKI